MILRTLVDFFFLKSQAGWWLQSNWAIDDTSKKSNVFLTQNTQQNWIFKNIQ